MIYNSVEKCFNRIFGSSFTYRFYWHPGQNEIFVIVSTQALPSLTYHASRVEQLTSQPQGQYISNVLSTSPAFYQKYIHCVCSILVRWIQYRVGDPMLRWDLQSAQESLLIWVNRARSKIERFHVIKGAAVYTFLCNIIRHQIHEDIENLIHLF